MPAIYASWQLSAWIAATLAGVTVVARATNHPLTRRLGAFAREFTVVVALFAVYQYCGHYAHIKAAGGFVHARQIIDFERALHLPGEAWVQGLITPHPWAVRTVNAYYAAVHLTSMTGFIVWVWWRHGDFYPRVRNIVAVSTLSCLLVQMVPVAPPRMFPELGFVDTALQYGQSVYGPNGTGIADQLAAMPSIHVLWAGIIAYYAVRMSSSRWRWVLVAHFVVTVFVVVASANHWWLDGVVAIGILALVLATFAAVRTLRDRAARSGDDPPMVVQSVVVQPPSAQPSAEQRHDSARAASPP